jgi:hypothetical protein
MADITFNPAGGRLSIPCIRPLFRFLELSKEKLGMRIDPHDSYIVAGNAVKAVHVGPLVQYVTALRILDLVQFVFVVQFAHIEELHQTFKLNQCPRPKPVDPAI